MKGVLQAVTYIHNKGIVHRDLKPGKSLTSNKRLENILFRKKKRPETIKIVDFGLSAKYDHYSMI
jgi:serine/threonine protein kinase